MALGPRCASGTTHRLSSLVDKLCHRVSLELELGLSRLAPQRAPDVLAQLGKARRAERVAAARARQVDRDSLVDGARPALEHDDAVAHQHRLLDRVGDEHHGGRPLLPDAQQLELQDLAGLRVDGGERLVHQAARVGSIASARARPQRCCMPPDIWYG